jgi:Rod binding domain-containing protein
MNALSSVNTFKTFAQPRAAMGQHEQLVEQTRKWVSQTFFGAMLKQMRDSTFKSELFSGGQGGQAFSSLHDQYLAEHMARGAGNKLVNGIVRRIEANAAYRKNHAPTARRT